jgi:hypothetical protein
LMPYQRPATTRSEDIQTSSGASLQEQPSIHYCLVTPKMYQDDRKHGHVMINEPINKIRDGSAWLP